MRLIIIGIVVVAMRENRGKIEIRLAALEEAGSISWVLHEAFVEYKALYTKGGFAATTPTTEQVAARMREGPVWVAVREGAIIGTGSAVSRGESLYIRGMAVLPAARGHGVGEALLKQIESYAREHGHRRLALSTTPFLNRAIRLYERAGFKASNDGPQDLFGTPLFTMVKALGSAEE